MGLREKRTCRRCGFKWVDEYGEYRSCPSCRDN